MIIANVMLEFRRYIESCEIPVWSIEDTRRIKKLYGLPNRHSRTASIVIQTFRPWLEAIPLLSDISWTFSKLLKRLHVNAFDKG